MEAIAQAQPNIALIKYWGKRNTKLNLPAVQSLSITLDALWTRTQVTFDESIPEDRLAINGRVEITQLQRVSNVLDRCRRRAGVTLRAKVTSKSNFPVGAGFASSSSGFAALAAATIKALEIELSPRELSAIARRASGSAARSVFGGFVEMPFDADDDVARPLLDAASWPLRVVIAVTTDQPKSVGSTAGMQRTARTSDYYPAWLDAAERDFSVARQAVVAHDFSTLAEVSERNCLKMHGVMMSSSPGLIYWNGASVECMHTIRRLRDSDVPVFFTVDAGPQVKAVCTPEHLAVVRDALRSVPGVSRVYESCLGPGVRIVESLE